MKLNFSGAMPNRITCNGKVIWPASEGEYAARAEISKTRPKQEETTIDTTERQLMQEISAELSRARQKFPGKNVTFAALIEEIGELATALFEEPRSAIRAEAVQVAVMAMRVVLDGDHTFEPWRAEKGLDAITTRKPETPKEETTIKNREPKRAGPMMLEALDRLDTLRGLQPAGTYLATGAVIENIRRAAEACETAAPHERRERAVEIAADALRLGLDALSRADIAALYHPRTPPRAAEPPRVTFRTRRKPEAGQ